MDSFQQCMQVYKQLLQQGQLQQAYQGLMQYMLDLRNHVKSRHPDFSVSNNLYFGYMDMTYFACFPPLLKARSLKIAVVFIHPTFRFEVWLSAVNKQVQADYWQRIKARGWGKYRLVESIQGADSILEHILVDDPDFSDLPALTARIEAGTLAFIRDIESFLAQT